MSKVLVTGAKGQLGRELKKLRNRYRQLYTFTDLEELDVTEKERLCAYLEKNRFDYIINCAAYTDVDKAEQDQEEARRLNEDAVQNLRDCLDMYSGMRLFHISTDYVFKGDGNRPLTEEDIPEPVSIYGKTKRRGEEILDGHPAAIVLRSSWLYSVFGKNFVKSMINRMDQREDIGVVFDQIGTPTHAEDLANVIMKIISDLEEQEISFTPGLFHYSNEGVCSWYDFAVVISLLIKSKCNILPILTDEYPLPAPRPAYSVLNKSKIKEVYRVDIPYWRTSLEKCIKELL